MRSVAKISQPYSSKPRGKVATIPRLFPFACYTKCEGTVAVSVVATVKLIPITLVKRSVMTLASCTQICIQPERITHSNHRAIVIDPNYFTRLNDAPRDGLRRLACTSGGWFQVRCAAGAS
jgi:hypothetical protein